MITEDSFSDNQEKNQAAEENLQQSPENQADTQTQKSMEIPEEKVLSEVDDSKEEIVTEEVIPETAAEKTNTETVEEPKPEHQENEETKKSIEIPEEKVLSEIDPDKADDEEHHEEEEHLEAAAALTLPQILNELEKIVNKSDAGAHHKEFNTLKQQATHLIHDETEDKKHEHENSGNSAESFSYEHPAQSKLSALNNIYREKHDDFLKKQEEEHGKNLENRQSIIERLKNLYTNSEPGTNLFKEIRSIKEDWQKAGQVAKSEFKLLNNNYFHHLNQFYAMLDLNKEYLEQEFAHNLEKRQHIIDRARELQNEPAVQKALNELQYLHKLWKEEAEPVAEEFREKTWEEFKEISNKIHERKSELSAVLESEQNANLERKNSIIAEIAALTSTEKSNHSYWQQAIKKVEELRTDFLKTGSVPRKISNQNWTDFKQTLRNFNSKKNDFYKSLKTDQVSNLDQKQQLIQTAKDNMNSEDWEIAVPLFKKLQEDWKKIGHVPRSQANKVWEDFREACNTFFNNYREKNNTASGDNWKENYKNKKAVLDQLKEVGEDENSASKIEELKAAWNAIGKVPRDKIGINSEFNKTLREKLKINKMSEYDLKDEGLSESQVTDKARKIKNQVSDLEAEIVKLENNLAFFQNPSRENPLLKDTFDKIDQKKSELEHLKQNLHNIITGDNS